MPLTRDIVEKKLRWPLADPYEPVNEDLYLRSDDTADATGFEKWYRALSAADQGTVLGVVLEWLASGDREKISIGLWFVGLVDPAEVFMPPIECLAGQFDQELGPRAYLDPMFLQFLRAVDRLNAVTVIPYLKRWAEHVDGPTSDWVWTSLVVLNVLSRFDRDASLAFIDRIVRSSETYKHPLSYSSILEYFVGGYVVARPDELEPLAKALSNAMPEVKEKVASYVKKQADTLVRVGRRTSDWAREAVAGFIRALGGPEV